MRAFIFLTLLLSISSAYGMEKAPENSNRQSAIAQMLSYSRAEAVPTDIYNCAWQEVESVQAQCPERVNEGVREQLVQWARGHHSLDEVRAIVALYKAYIALGGVPAEKTPEGVLQAIRGW